MKKVLSSILISVIIFANLFAPISVGLNKRGVEIKKNISFAEYKYSLKIIPTLGDKYIKLDVEALEDSETGDIALLGVITESSNLQVKATVLKDGKETGFDDTEQLAAQARKVTLTLGDGFFSKLTPGTPYQTKIELIERLWIQTNAGTAGTSGSFQTKTLYETTIDTPTQKEGEEEKITQIVDINGKSDTLNKPEASALDTMPGCSITGIGKGTFTGCIAQAFYYVLFIPTSYLFALSGVFFDNTFAYSVQDTSYRSTFVVEGWGMVRDFCNMFFIFVLLYIAIGTILSLHGFKAKETIINVVIIGLLINFSLLATQLIIDASNITARVFYNADTIQITENGADGVANLTPGLDEGENGVIPLSAALVNKVNPQNIIIHSGQINKVPVKGSGDLVQDEEAGSLTAGSFILIVMIASAVNIVGFIVFLTIGMLFIARVVGLWLAMVLAPLAFFTYILPEEMAGIKMIGWKNWWPDTLKLAFLAPVFIFFMFIILKFLDLDIIADAKNKDGLTFFIATLMPFAFIMIFLMKAKKIAVDMAGQMGEFATKAGSAVGGMVLGGAVGVGAMAMRGTLGRMGNSLSQNESLKEAEAKGGIKGFGARMLLKGGEKAGAGSYDARNTKIGAEAGKGLGVDMGKAKEGGYTKMKADQIAASQKRAKELELGEGSHEKQALNKAEAELKRLQNASSHALKQTQLQIDAGKDSVVDANSAVNAAKAEMERTEKIVAAAGVAATAAQIAEAAAAVADYDNKVIEASDAVKDLKVLKDHKAGIRNASVTTRTTTNTAAVTARADAVAARLVAAGAAIGSALDIAATKAEKKAATLENRVDELDEAITAAAGGPSIFELETSVIPDAHHHVEQGNNRRKTNIANNLESNTSKIVNIITTGGQYSRSGANQAAHAIRMDIKTEGAGH